MTDIEKIFWHDTVVHRIEEDCESNLMTFFVEYPRNWEKNLFEKGTIVFHDCQIDAVETTWIESTAPVIFSGSPAISDVDMVEQRERWMKLRIATNGWTRIFWCTGVTLNCTDENG